jgi:hypothetical protein
MDYDELTAKIIRRDRGHQDAEELYVLSEPPFERLDADAVWEEFEGLFEHDQETPWMHDGFTIDEHKRRVEWGASGYGWELVVEAGKVVPEAVIAYGLTKVLDRLADRLGVRDIPPLDRDGALNKARWAILLGTPSLKSDELGAPVSEEHDTERQRWIFKYRPANGYEYTVEVGWHGKVPGVVRWGKTELLNPQVQAYEQNRRTVVKPGDILDSGEVVVDVTGDNLAVLREFDDPEGGRLRAAPVDQLTVTGHLEHLDGWVEDSPGVWRKT